ncbi:MAG: hypothetical protein VXV96_05185 [Bdellovibrionota bacterium]|nr:hypothetical protein [Bdellovibrionota bacterium]
MKCIPLIVITLFSLSSNANQIKRFNGRVAVMPEKITSLQFIPNEELSEFCDSAMMYLEQFRSRVEDYNCLENPKPICNSIKRIFERVSTGEGVIGTNLNAQVKLGLLDPTFSTINKKEVSESHNVDEEQIILSPFLNTEAYVNVEGVFQSQGTFHMALQLLEKEPQIAADTYSLTFSERLSACAFDNFELSVRGLAKVQGQFKDTLPKSGEDFLLNLSSKLKDLYTDHEGLNDSGLSSHLRGFELLTFGLKLEKLEREFKNSPILEQYPRLQAYKRMEIWWQAFFETHPKKGTILFSEFKTEDSDKFYYPETKTLNSLMSFEIFKGVLQ